MIVVPPVLKLLSNATTDDHFQLIRVNSHVSLIEQRVHVTSQKQTILGFMRTNRAVSLDVRSLQHRQCTLARDRTSTVINVGDGAEYPLRWGLSGGPVLAVVSFSLDNIKAEIRGYRNPFSFFKKEWFSQEYAPDLWVLHRSDGYASILRDPFTHFRKRSNSVAFSESFP